MRPYRISAGADRPSAAEDSATTAALIAAYAFVWIAALAHVVHLRMENAPFGIEGTLATLVVVLLPLLALASLLQSRRQSRSRSA